MATPKRSVQINKAFIGKTIDSVAVNRFNQWTFHFTDGSEQIVLTEYFGNSIYGPVLYPHHYEDGKET